MARPAFWAALVFRLGLVALLAAGCNPEDEGSAAHEAVRSTDPDGVVAVEFSDAVLDALPAWELGGTPVVTIGAEDLPGHDLYAVRGGSVLSDGRIVLANSGSSDLRVYSADGAFETSMGSSGEGPGEFRGIHTAAALPGDTLIVYDSRNRRFSRFTADGQSIGDVPVAPELGFFPQPVGVLSSGITLMRQEGGSVFAPGVKRDTATYMLVARDAERSDTLAVRPGTEMLYVVGSDIATRMPVAFGVEELAGAGGRTIAIGSSDQYAIEVLGIDGQPRVRLRGETAPCPVTDGDFETWRSEFLDSAPSEARSTWLAVSEEMPRRETHPAFEDVVVDRLGRVWVERNQCATGEPVWNVFSADGDPLGQLALGDKSILDSGEDFVLTLRRDDLDREIVELHRLDMRE